MAKKKGKSNTKKQEVEKPVAAEIVEVENTNHQLESPSSQKIESDEVMQGEEPLVAEAEKQPQLVDAKVSSKTEEVETSVDADKIEELQKLVEQLQLQLAERDSKIQGLVKLPEAIPVKEDNTNEELEGLKQQLQLKNEESEKHKENYDKLLSRVSQMKTIFQKMKESEAKLEEVEVEKSQLKEQLENVQQKMKMMENSTAELNSEILNLNSECTKLTEENSTLQKQIETNGFELENDSKLLEDENKRLKKELKETKSDLEEYLILIQEEKASKTSSAQELTDLKSKFSVLMQEKDASDSLCQTLNDEITKLKLSIEELKQEEEKIVANVKAQLDSKMKQLNQFTDEINELKSIINEKDTKLESLTELENSLKEKQLLIGKLRHETITLNEHLNKAMKLIKKESGKETVDRELISNLFISFLQIPRGDNKKFEVLQLLANFLDWDDEKKRHAGLLSAGSYKSKSNSIVEVPTPGVNTSSSQSFVSLWTEFLEKESTPKDSVSTTK